MPEPSSFLQWLHQTYNNQWKGTVDITTVPAEDHAPKHAHWVSTITATGGVVKSSKDGKNITLEPITAMGDARSKKAAEHAAAEQIYRQLVEEGWWDPEGPAKPKKTGGVSRAHRYITDSTPCNEHNPLAYLDVSVAGQPAGRIFLELFRYKKGSTLDLHAPMAVDNFLALCRGVEVGGRQLSYVGVPFTRVVRRFVVQAGDVVNKDGSGGAHIHSSCGEHFPDEGLDDKSYRHTFPYMLSAANLGLEDTNGSQFFITVAPCASLDGYHTCFGKVLRGYSTVKEIESVHQFHSASGRAGKAAEVPPVPIVITAAGELPPGSVLDDVSAPLLMGGGYPMWPEDQGPPPEGVREVAFRLDISAQLRQQGNEAYKQGDAATALRRYRQAYQYLSWTTFKHRLPDGDVDLTYDEQDAIWQAEGVLLCNMVAAQNKLGQYMAAVAETCPDMFRKAADNPKAYLRAAQSRIGLGPAEYDVAVSLLKEALNKAQQQQLPTRDIIAELHLINDLRKAHSAKLRATFTAAFNNGLLHLPADDEPAATAATAAAASTAGSRIGSSAAGRTWRGLPAAGGPVGPGHVLEDASKPIVVDDAWGTHLLLAEDDDDEEDLGSSSEGEENGAAVSSSSRQRQQRRQQQPWGQQRLTDLLMRQARLERGRHSQGLVGAAAPAGCDSTAAAAAVDGDDSWGGLLGSCAADVEVDAEEAAGSWWKEEGEDSDEEAAGADTQQSGGQGLKQQGEPLFLQQRQQQQWGVYGGAAMANGSSNGHHAGGGAAAGVADSSSTFGHHGEHSQESEDGEGGAADEDGECGVPEAEDPAAHQTVVVSDSSSVTKQGYGWKPETLPRWSSIK